MTEIKSASDPTWYIVRQISEECVILPNPASSQPFSHETVGESSVSGAMSGSSGSIANNDSTSPGQIHQTWGPFSSKEEAIAKRIGLIRSGKCKPK